MTSHILIIRLSAFGDVAMTVPAISVLRDNHPGVKITILTTEFFSTLYNQIPNINFLFFKPKHKSIYGLFHLSRQIMQINPDHIIDLHDVLRTKILRIFLAFKFNRILIIDKGRKEKKSLINGTIFRRLKTMHQRYADVFSLEKMNIDLELFNTYSKININNKIHEFDLNKRLIGIAPFAGHNCKEYSLANILKLIDLIGPSYQILIFGAPGEEEKKIKKISQEKTNTHIISSNYSLSEQMAVISNLDVMISMDSANGHIASLFGVNVITIWGATHPFTGYSPFNQPNKNSIIPDLKKFPKVPVTIYGSKCPKDYHNAINSIRPEIIFKRVKQIV